MKRSYKKKRSLKGKKVRNAAVLNYKQRLQKIEKRRFEKDRLEEI